MRCPFGAAALIPALLFATSVYAQTNSQTAKARVQLTPSDSVPRAHNKRPTVFAMDAPAPARPLARGRTMLFGGWHPSDRMMVGVGLFSIPKSATANPQEARIDPLKDPTGKTRRVAAIGMSFRF
jgi:hypothetical protein